MMYGMMMIMTMYVAYCFLIQERAKLASDHSTLLTVIIYCSITATSIAAFNLSYRHHYVGPTDAYVHTYIHTYMHHHPPPLT